jgi:hypothetical protein
VKNFRVVFFWVMELREDGHIIALRNVDILPHQSTVTYIEDNEEYICHSSPSIAEVKNAWSYTSNLPICLQGVVLD